MFKMCTHLQLNSWLPLASTKKKTRAACWLDVLELNTRTPQRSERGSLWGAVGRRLSLSRLVSVNPVDSWRSFNVATSTFYQLVTAAMDFWLISISKRTGFFTVLTSTSTLHFSRSELIQIIAIREKSNESIVNDRLNLTPVWFHGLRNRTNAHFFPSPFSISFLFWEPLAEKPTQNASLQESYFVASTSTWSNIALIIDSTTLDGRDILMAGAIWRRLGCIRQFNDISSFHARRQMIFKLRKAARTKCFVDL